MEVLELITWLLCQKEASIESTEDPKTLARGIKIYCRAWAPHTDGKSLKLAQFGIAINSHEDLQQALTHLHNLVESKKKEAATIGVAPY